MKVAIIDDSSFMRRLIRSALLECHPQAQITEFSDAAAALAALPALAPDLITLDMLMPGKSGLTFLTESHAAIPQLPPIIVISADVQKSVKEKCHAFGIVDFIEKPITPEKLIAALAKLVPA